MNTIKLPVEVYSIDGSTFRVEDSEGGVICHDLSRRMANQIATALNSHHELMALAKAVSNCKTLNDELVCRAMAETIMGKVER